MPENTARNHPPGVHLAFLYSLAMPGFGEYRLGARFRGLLTMGLVLACFGWFCWVLVDVVNSLFELAPPSLSLYLQMAAALAGIMFLWLWGMFAAVDVAVERGLRREDERSPFWAALMSWLCPGTGQLYTGSRAFAFGLFICYLMATLFLFPAYKLEINLIRSLLTANTLQFSPFKALAVIREAGFRLDYGFANLSVTAVEAVSMILAVAALQPVWYGQFIKAARRRLQRGPDGKAPSERSLPFGQRTEARVLSILALGWLCPGSGQLLMKQGITGWSLFCLYLFGKIAIGVLLTTNLIGYDTAQSWTWVPSAARIVSMGLGLISVTAKPKPGVLDTQETLNSPGSGGAS